MVERREISLGRLLVARHGTGHGERRWVGMQGSESREAAPEKRQGLASVLYV